MQAQRRVGALGGEVARPLRARPRRTRSGSCRCRPAPSYGVRSCSNDAPTSSRCRGRTARHRARRTSASCSHRARGRCPGATAAARRPCTSWPILRTPGSSSSGFSGQRDWSPAAFDPARAASGTFELAAGPSSTARSSSAAGAVRQRDIGGETRRQRQRDPGQCRPGPATALARPDRDEPGLSAASIQWSRPRSVSISA